MVKQIDYKKGFETIGEFFLQENPDIKYSGILTYSPENGIKLVLMYDFSKSLKFWNHTRNEYYSFYGNVAEYGEITLIGGMQQGGYCDFGTTNKVEFYISYLILGAHLNRTDKCVYGAVFSFPGFENFCSHITGRQLYYKTPLMEHNIAGINYKIRNVPDNINSIDSLLFPVKDNEQLIKEISDKLSSTPLQLGDFNPKFFISQTEGITFWEMIRQVFSIEKLISVLLLTAVETDKLSISVKQGDKEKNCQVLHKLSDKANKIKIGHHAHLPVNLDNIKDKFPTILPIWQELTRDEFNITNIVLTDKLFGRSEVGYQSFYLYISFAEEWQKRYNKKMGLKAYLEENVQIDDFIYNKFKDYFPDITNVQNISGHLGAIRNCIAHTRNKFDNYDEYKEHKEILENEIAMRNLCEILFLLFVRTIYKKFGIEQTRFQQENFERQLCLWNTISC